MRKLYIEPRAGNAPGSGNGLLLSSTNESIGRGYGGIGFAKRSDGVGVLLCGDAPRFANNRPIIAMRDNQCDDSELLRPQPEPQKVDNSRCALTALVSVGLLAIGGMSQPSCHLYLYVQR